MSYSKRRYDPLVRQFIDDEAGVDEEDEEEDDEGDILDGIRPQR